MRVDGEWEMRGRPTLVFTNHSNYTTPSLETEEISQERLQLLHMAGVLGSAVVQEAISRVASIIFRQREEKASREHNIERLEMAHTELELAIERSSKLPITEVSLLRRRKFLKRAYEECSDVLNGCKQQGQKDDEADREPMLTHSSFTKRISHATKSSIAHLFTTEKDDICYSKVRRLEWFADCASKFLRDVEFGCSFRHHTFHNPLLRQLLEGKTLRYEKVQESWLRVIYIWPICLGEGGIEAELSYQYKNYNIPERSFHFGLSLRLSENTDIVGIAMICLQHLASQFKLVAESAMGELTLLADLQDISHSYARPWAGIQESFAQVTQICRPDPLCCKPNGHETCPKDIVSSELSNKFPEQVIAIGFQYYASALKYNLHSSTDEADRKDQSDCSPPLLLTAVFAPHGKWADLTQNNESGAVSKGECRDGNIEQEIEMVRSKTIDRLILKPELMHYMTVWEYTHGFGYFDVRISNSEWLVYQNQSGYCRPLAGRVAKRRL
ncbi:hypothetical protein ACP70R_014577 [Stipagrostis hirtigluma subsp. patula]